MGQETASNPAIYFALHIFCEMDVSPCWSAAHDLRPQDFDKLLRGRHANLLVVPEREEVLISRHQVGGLCGDGAGDDHVVVGVAADGRRRSVKGRQVGKPAEEDAKFPGLPSVYT